MPEGDESSNTASPADKSAPTGDEGVGQREIDALLAGAMKEIQGALPGDVPSDDPPPQADTPTDHDGEPEPEEAGGLDQNELDRLLSEIGEDTSLDGKDLEQVIPAGSQDETSGMDEVVEGAGGGESPVPPIADEVIGAAPEEDADTKSLNGHFQEQTKEEVGSENLAAAAPADDALVSQDVIDAMLKDVGGSEAVEAAPAPEAGVPETAQVPSGDELAEELADLGLGTEREKSHVSDTGAPPSRRRQAEPGLSLVFGKRSHP